MKTLTENVNLRSEIIDSLFPKFDSNLKVIYNECSEEESIAIEKLRRAIEESCKINKIKKL
jgi:hypothetical protein|nr:MAG TPA: hypothetical protein [Caudoviricetes sp.]